MQPPRGPLSGQVALVAGATRAAGRGIARELAAAGAKVWCTGRSTRGAPATPGRPETIEETAELIAAAGGEALAVRVDHTQDAEVEALAGRLQAEEGRLDILVNDIWGGDEIVDWGAKGFWSQDMAAARTLVDRAVMSHWITARHLAPIMVAARRGLIVEVTDGESAGYRGNLLYDFCKASANRLAYAMVWDLARHGVTALAVSPGFLRSEAMLERFGVTETDWREGVARDPDFAFSETPHFVRSRHRRAGRRPERASQVRRGALRRRSRGRVWLHRPGRLAAAFRPQHGGAAGRGTGQGRSAQPLGHTARDQPLHADASFRRRRA
jgi:NAD(P)-dependent dehydrogenase (short-subunit alcohol dehydrogenase family)